ncbi:MAG TPA: glycosyltransferase family 39 protein [Nakamurella sp.]
MVGTIDLVHGFYYLLLHGWIEVFGSSAPGIRGFSVLAIGVAGACVYWLAERFRGRSFAFWAVLVFAVLPRVTWAGAEARSYAITVAFAAAATLVLLVVLDRDSRSAAAWWWVGYGLLVVGGVLSNLYVGLLLVAHLVSLLWDRRVTRAQRSIWLITAGATVAALAPFLLAAYRQAGQLSDMAFGLRDLLRNVAVNQFFLGDTPTTTTGASRTTIAIGDVGSLWLPSAVVLAIGGWALMIVAVIVHRDELARNEKTSTRPMVVWLLPWIVVPPAMIGIYSIAVSPMYGPRYLSFATPAVALLVAYGLTAIRSRWRIALAGLLVLAVIPVYVSQRQLYAKNSSDWISIAQFVAENARPGDGVYFAPRYDVGGATVGQTTRGIAVAYPDAFSGLVDLTLLRSAVEADDLVGESRYLSQSTDRLEAVDTVWVVRRVDHPADDAAADDDLLAAAGFERTQEWQGPLDEVIKWSRVPAS